MKSSHLVRFAWLIGLVWLAQARGQQPFTPPTLNNVNVTTPVLEDGVVTLTGSIADAEQNGFTLAINWGDLPAVQLVQLPAGSTAFSIGHQYLDNHQPGTSFTPFLINLAVTDTGGANNLDFLSAIFQDLLRRQIASSEQTYYLGYLSQGGARSGVVANLTGATEYRQRLVGDYYLKFLRRPADSSGLSYGVSFLAAGGTDEQFISTLTGSAEYFSNRGGGSNNGFLDALYFDLLARPVDPTARASFTAQLNSGTTPSQVSTEVLDSSEYRNDLVTALFWRFLHRSPSASDASFYVGLLNSGQTDEQLLASVAGSQEYFNVRSGGTATAQTSLIVSNVPPAFNTLSISSPIVEATSATLSGSILGEANSDSFSLFVNWGDGSSPQSFDLGTSTSFSFTHQYLLANPAYLVSVGVSDSEDPGTNFQTLRLAVTSAPSTIISVTFPNGLPHLVGQGIPSRTYSIQASSNLADWAGIGTAAADSTGKFTFDDQAPASPQRFYRVLSP